MVENTEDFRLFLFTPPTTDERIKVVREDGTVQITDNAIMVVRIECKCLNNVTVILPLFPQM